jgi:hypothetical protein
MSIEVIERHPILPDVVSLGSVVVDCRAMLAAFQGLKPQGHKP